MTDAREKKANGGPHVTSGGRGDVLFLSMAGIVAMAISAVNALSVHDERARVGRPIGLLEAVVWEASSLVVILSLLPALLWLTRRAWPVRPPPFRWIFVHVGAALAFSLIHVVAMGLLRSAAYALAGDRYDAWWPLRDWPYELRKDLLVYTGLVAIYVLWRTLRLRAAAQVARGSEVLEVRDGSKRHYLPLEDILWLEAAGNYVELHRSGPAVLHRASLSEMQRQLEPAGFVRIHRSRLVRRGAIAQVESKASGDFIVRLRDGREIAGSRRYRKPLLER